MTEAEFGETCVLITGAGSGLGAATAHAFAAHGALLVLGDRDGDALQAVANDIAAAGARVTSLVGDVRDEPYAADLATLALTEFGRLDVALNNAGIGGRFADLPNLASADFDEVMAINVRGVFLGMKYQIPAMQEAGRGVVLNTASAAGLIGTAGLAAYVASKHAVIGLTRTAAAENGARGIRINAICPGYIRTAMTDDLDVEAIDAVPMRRVAELDEIVQAMVWACRPGNSYMTGQTLVIDGGVTAVR